MIWNSDARPKVMTILNELVSVEFDGGLASEKIQQDGNTLPSRNHASYQSLESLEDTRGNLDDVAGVEVGGQDFYFLIADNRTQFGNDPVRDGRPAIAEVDDASNTTQRLDAPQQ